MKRRILALLFALLATQLGALVNPAYACGCGAMIPDGQSRIGVDRETSVVRWDGRTEQIVMRFSVGGDAHRAAWIMPVPGRATVELGDSRMFDELGRLTRPEHRSRGYFWPRERDWPFDPATGDTAGAPAPGSAAPPVGVVGREQLGDFDVARLTATDPDALRNWLESNGFKLPDRLATEVKPYVDQKWEYVAVRLAPATGTSHCAATWTRCGSASRATGWSTRCGSPGWRGHRNPSACTCWPTTAWSPPPRSAAPHPR